MDPLLRLHFSGIGGTGMVAAARLAIELGCEVRGSDQPLYPPTSELVAALGVPVANGYAAANLDWQPDAVVVGNALSRGNPEVEAALSRRMRYLSMAEWLKESVLRARRPVAVCGTHGKTTTTALTAYLLDHCGLAPGFWVGGLVKDFDFPARLGAPTAPFVIEGDEYDSAFFDKRAKFLHYLPEVAVVTSIEFDHGDIYRDLDEIDTAFQRLLRQVPAEGLLLACGDNRAAMLTADAPCRVETYGLGAACDWRVELAPPDDLGRTPLRMYRGSALWCETAHPLPGRHNAQNALAAAAVAAYWGATPAQVAEALPAFQGIRRRLEVFHAAHGVVYVDDFAHHPTAIRETIAAARLRWPGRRLRVLFEPRSNTTVTRRFQGPLAEALAGADEVVVGPVYRADRIAPDERLDRAALVAALDEAGAAARTADDIAALAEDVRATGREGDVVLVLSNGAFGGIYARLRAS